MVTLLPVKLCPQFLYFTVQLSLLHASAQSYEFISADAEQVEFFKVPRRQSQALRIN